MNIPNGVTDFLFYLAPSLLVFLTSWFLVKKFLDTDQKLRYAELKRSIDNNLLPLRLQAYERIVLFLERISPNNLIVRIYEKGMSANDLHQALIQTIRSEYEHNITQQVYVTNSVWNAVRKGRDELIKVINIAMKDCPENAPGAELNKRIFENLMKLEESPVQTAIDEVKNEAHALF